MVLPQAIQSHITIIRDKWWSGGFFPLGEDLAFLENAANTDPLALKPIVDVVVKQVNRGVIQPGFIYACLRFLGSLANIAESLRAEINSSISRDLVDYYCSQNDTRQIAESLAETLRVERPRHYYDLSRNILIAGGCVFIIGAGVSYDSYAPLFREMEGIACSTLYDLGVENPRDMYESDEKKAWRLVADGWHTFQQHVHSMLIGKEPSDQHFILAELFHDGIVKHIVSLNWDDLIEKAYRIKYGNEIPIVASEGNPLDHALWKLHGDIRSPEERWVLPYEEGRVFKSLADLLRTLDLPTIVIGYKEQEQIVRDQVISVLEQRGGLTRIRPDIDHDPKRSFRDNAANALKKLKAGLAVARSVSGYM